MKSRFLFCIRITSMHVAHRLVPPLVLDEAPVPVPVEVPLGRDGLPGEQLRLALLQPQDVGRRDGPARRRRRRRPDERHLRQLVVREGEGRVQAVVQVVCNYDRASLSPNHHLTFGREGVRRVLQITEVDGLTGEQMSERTLHTSAFVRESVRCPICLIAKSNGKITSIMDCAPH